MSAAVQAAALVFPHPAAPAPGDIGEIAPGVLWLRLGLPFQLDHVNIYLIEDGPGWTVVDTGIADPPTRACWEGIATSHLRGRPITRLIVTHFHPDHAGLAGWMVERFGAALWMPRVEYFLAQNLRHNPDALGVAAHRAHYLGHGLAPDLADALMTRGQDYLRMTTALPPSFRALEAGASLSIGGRRFEVLTGGGHAPEQAMLLCREARLFLAADQVLARISPNISVWPWEPHGNPLGAYLSSLADIRAGVPDDVLVLAAHNLPFHGLHQRILELTAHHEQRCAEIAASCATAPRSVAALVPVLFPRPMDAHQSGFAFAETLAHVNLMLARGVLQPVEPEGSVARVMLSKP